MLRLCYFLTLSFKCTLTREFADDEASEDPKDRRIPADEGFAVNQPITDASAFLVEQLRQWMNSTEGEHFEFKEVKNDFSFEKLAQYCCAFANENGGKVILGVTDKRPRHVVGTHAFQQMENARKTLKEKIPLNIEVHEIHDSGKRVLVFDIPSRPVGVPIKYDGKYWSREGESLVAMSENRLRAIFAEAGHDFSADICHGATMQDIDLNAVEEFRRRWIEKTRNHELASLTVEQ